VFCLLFNFFVAGQPAQYFFAEEPSCEIFSGGPPLGTQQINYIWARSDPRTRPGPYAIRKHGERNRGRPSRVSYNSQWWVGLCLRWVVFEGPELVHWRNDLWRNRITADEGPKCNNVHRPASFAPAAWAGPSTDPLWRNKSESRSNFSLGEWVFFRREGARPPRRSVSCAKIFFEVV